METDVFGHIPNEFGGLVAPTCDIKLLNCLGWCGRVLFCSDKDSSFFTAWGDAAPNFGGLRSFESVRVNNVQHSVKSMSYDIWEARACSTKKSNEMMYLPFAEFSAAANWILRPSLVELVELVVDSVGDGCRLRIVTVFGAEPPLGSHSSDNSCSLSSSVITLMLFK